VDARIAIWVATHRVAALNDPFVWLGTIDRLGAVWVALALVVGILCHRGLRGTVGLVLLTALTTFVADSFAFAVKDATSRTRPFQAHPQIHPLYVVHSSSLPAGHAATAFAGAVLLSSAAPRLAPFFAGLAILIGFSRVYVGVHYPTDVLAGAALGCAVGLAAAVVVRMLGPRLREWRGSARGARRNVRSTA
jgi:undecaprenyl-diphosphatase